MRKVLKTLGGFALWYVATFVVLFSIPLVMLLVYEGGGLWQQVKALWAQVLPALGNIMAQAFLVLPYLVFRLLAFWVRRFRRGGLWAGTKAVLYSFVLPGALLLATVKGLVWYNLQEAYAFAWDHSVENQTGHSANRYAQDGKHRGIHMFARYRNIEEELDLLVNHNVEWMTLVPYGYQADAQSPNLQYRGREAGGFSRRDSMFMRQCAEAKARGLHIMIKPHIWMNGSAWRNEITMGTAEEWATWFGHYEVFMLHNVALANAVGAEAFCVGTELHAAAKAQPERWRRLIATIRGQYAGKLVYAANWYEEYEDVTFWDDLDYIGIQAYFPLSTAASPDARALKKGWKAHARKLKAFSERWQKPILFTEVGYKSTTNAAEKPWEWEDGAAGLVRQVSFETQARCYEALFETFWDEPWFAGVHLWKWEGSNEFSFSPKEKPACNIMARWFVKEARPVAGH